MVYQAVIPNLGGLTDDDAHAVVNDKALAYLCAGVDLNARAAAAGLGYGPGDQGHMMGIEPVGLAVAAGGFQAGIKKIYFQRALCRRVTGHIGRDSLSKIVKHCLHYS